MTLNCMTSSLFYLLFSRADYDRHKLRAYNSFDDCARPVGLPSDPRWPCRHVIPWNLIAVVTGLNELYLAYAELNSELSQLSMVRDTQGECCSSTVAALYISSNSTVAVSGF